MPLTLAADLAAPTTLAPAIRLTITGTVPDAIGAGYLFRLEDEVLELKYFGETQQSVLGGAATQTVDDRNVWYAQRGLNGTTIATHDSGTAVLGVADPALVAGADEDVPGPFAGAGGTSVHGELDEREAADGHPIAAVTGLEDALAAAGTSGLLTATRTLTSAEILDLGSTPVEVIPGIVGKYLWLLDAIGIYRAGATPYTVSTGTITLGTQTGNVSVLSASDAPLAGAVDQLLQFLQVATNGSDLSTEAGVAIYAYNLDAAATLGDGTVELTIIYLILDAS